MPASREGRPEPSATRSAPPSIPSPPPPVWPNTGSDTLRSDEMRTLDLEQKLGPDNPEVRLLHQRLRDAQRQQQQLGLSSNPQDAAIRHQQLDDSLRALEAQRLRVEEEAARQPPAGLGQQQK